MEIEKEYLTEREVSKITGRALSTLRNDRANLRGLPFIKWGKKFIRYKKADVIEFMENLKVQTKTENIDGEY